jgi:hypothetical protein
MIVNSTDLKSNLGKYLRLSAKEEIFIRWRLSREFQKPLVSGPYSGYNQT